MLIERLLVERMSLRGIWRTVGVTLKWLLGVLVPCFVALPDHQYAAPARLPSGPRGVILLKETRQSYRCHHALHLSLQPSRALLEWRGWLGWTLTLCSPIAWPGVVEHDAQPEQSEAAELVEEAIP